MDMISMIRINVQEDFSRKVYGKEEQSLAKDGKNLDYIYYVSLVF